MTMPTRWENEVILEFEGPAERVLYAVAMVGGLGIGVFPVLHGLRVGFSPAGCGAAAAAGLGIALFAFHLLTRCRSGLILDSNLDLALASELPWRRARQHIASQTELESVAIVREPRTQARRLSLKLRSGEEVGVGPWFPATVPAVREAAQGLAAQGQVELVDEVGGRDATEHAAAFVQLAAFLAALGSIGLVVSRAISSLGW